MRRTTLYTCTIASCFLSLGSQLQAQHVTLPLPRLQTLMPMGGTAGSEVEITITADNAEDISALSFSDGRIKAQPILGEDGLPVENRFKVLIPKEVPEGVYDARVHSRLGVSSSRVFSVSHLKEVIRTSPNTSLETALPLEIGSICNATMTTRAVDHYKFQGKKGQKVFVECAAVRLDSRLQPVLIIANEKGQDLKVNRTGSPLDFEIPEDGTYVIKVHDLTYLGSPRHFYRLALQELPVDGTFPVQAKTLTVSAMSWPPQSLSEKAAAKEVEPNHQSAQKITLPCNISGSFFPAADVDTFEFTANAGETWWVEVASERFGLNTDPFVLVQQIKKDGDKEVAVDVAELYDIEPPMKVSSNGYSYDGPPYNAGSPDVNGKFEVKENGTYRLQLRDLFGGTRNEPSNIYRLIVRKAQPDFSLATWAVHMTMRNGDRNALSKPLALRSGDARVMEVVVQRRDGFADEIELHMEGLPPGVTATGLKIGKGKTFGHIVITSAVDAPPGFSVAKLVGTAVIDGNPVRREGRLASMAWAVVDAKGEIPSPRLMADIPVSVSQAEKAPVAIAATEDKVYEAKAGETLKIPVKFDWRQELVGTSLKLKAYGDGFTAFKEIEVPVKTAQTEVVLDLAALKLPPGNHNFALYGQAVSKYSYNADAVPMVKAEQEKAAKRAAEAAAEAKKLAAIDANAAKVAAEKQKQAEAFMTKMTQKVKSVTEAAAPKDTVDVVVSKPIRLKIHAAN